MPRGELVKAPAYPPARRSKAVRVFHGESVPDPYDWLGGPDTPESAAWQKAQDELADRFLGGTERVAMQTWLDAYLSRPHSFRVIERGMRRFFLRDEAGRDQPALFVVENGNARLLLDPAMYGAGGAIVQHSIAVSPDGAHVAMAVAAEGSETHAIVVVESQTARGVDGVSPKVIVPEIAWSKQGDGFFYNRNQRIFVPEAERAPGADGIYWHRIGTPFERDVLVCEQSWPDAHITPPTVSDDGALLFVSEVHIPRRRCRLAMHRLTRENGAPRIERTDILIEGGEGQAHYLGESGGESFFVMEDDKTERGRLVAIDRARPERAAWRTLIDNPDEPIAVGAHPLRAATGIAFKGEIYLTQIRDAHHRLAVYDLNGAHRRDVPLPAICSMAGPGGERYGAIGVSGDGAALLFELWMHAHRQLPVRYDPRANVLSWIFPAEVDEAALRTRVTQIFCETPDGARIPAFVIDAGAESGRKPTLLYAYGGFGTSITPEFSPDIPLWLKMGGRYVIANIRGGGEYGKAWHEAARRRNRKVATDDFCAVAAALVERGLASRDTLGIRGISSGGLLMGTCYVARPELFAAVISELPLLDMLALGADDWGRALAPEYGDPVSDAGDLAAMRRLSPLQNVAARSYPPVLVVAADRDMPALIDGGRKFVAAVQAAAPDTLALFRLVRGCGHTAWPRSATVRMIAEEMNFLAKTLGVALRASDFTPQKGDAP